MNDWTRRTAIGSGLGLAAVGMLGHEAAFSKDRGKMRTTFSPELESLRAHHVPDWFRDAKLGIFIHWGPYSIPAFAPTDRSMSAIGETTNAFALNPYAEWYQNTMLFEGGATAAYHRRTYGDASYEVFGSMFNAALEAWSPEAWVDQFVRAGARYVVLVTKHHDGFLMWRSSTPNPHLPNWGVKRDVVGELAAAARARGLKFGIYYSGGLDWTFKHPRIESIPSIFTAVPGTPENYTGYVMAHYRELIARYKPDYLWNDIAFPTREAFLNLAAHYYNAVPDGLINDRWITPDGIGAPNAFEKPAGVTGLLPPQPMHWDVRTPEYGLFDRVLPFDWETTRGIGKSFGYNRQETERDLIAPDELIRMLSQASCYNGNLLLNVGPRGDTKIDPPQADRLDALGGWLDSAGESIRGTRPVALGASKIGNVPIGATRRGKVTYLHFMGRTDGAVEVPWADAPRVAQARMLGGAPISVSQTDKGLSLTLPQVAKEATRIVKLTMR